MSSSRLSFTGFEEWDSKLTLQHRVLELETRFRPPEQSDRFAAGWVRAGGLDSPNNV